jgi:hypothetical protein
MDCGAYDVLSGTPCRSIAINHLAGARISSGPTVVSTPRFITHIQHARRPQATSPVGVDAFAHGQREYDLDEEFMTLAKLRAQLVLGLNMPGRGVAAESNGFDRFVFFVSSNLRT